MKHRDLLALAILLCAWLAMASPAAAHPLDDLCGMDRWACARRFTPPADVPQSIQDEDDQPDLAIGQAAAPQIAPPDTSAPARPTRPSEANGSRPPAAPLLETGTPESAVSPQVPERNEPLSPPDRPLVQTIGLYLQLGFLHILPKGLDHILFVLSLFLASTRLRPLLIQITTFTIAHTITLALAASGVVSAPAAIVEPLIALSIAFVAIENIFFKDMTRWRPLVVFGFGLFHGLGFAGVLAELGLPQHQFTAALVSFNVGVEAGQLTVVGLALIPSLLLRRLLQREDAERLYRPIAVVPASVCIAIIAIWWAVERTFLGG